MSIHRIQILQENTLSFEKWSHVTQVGLALLILSPPTGCWESKAGSILEQWFSTFLTLFNTIPPVAVTPTIKLFCYFITNFAVINI